MAKTKSFEDKLAERAVKGAQIDELDQEIVTEFLVEAAPVIAKLRLIEEKMSDSISFTGRAKQVLQQIDNGLLRDPLAVKIVEKMRLSQENPDTPDTPVDPGPQDPGAPT